MERSSTKAQRPVVVGVDPAPESLAAARYAIDLASRRGLGLILAHAYPLPDLDTVAMAEQLELARTHAREFLGRVRAQLPVPDGLEVQTVLEADGPALLLERLAERASLVVLGQDHLTWGERLLHGAVADRVARRAPCPVVVVPGNWHPRAAGHPHPVVVALERDHPVETLLGTAFDEAGRRHTTVFALQAAPYGSTAAELAEQRRRLADELAAWHGRSHGAAAHAEVVPGDPDAALLRWSRSASLLVVGRPQRAGWGAWTVSVAHAVLRHAHCPLMVVPAGRGAVPDPEPSAQPAEPVNRPTSVLPPAG